MNQFFEGQDQKLLVKYQQQQLGKGRKRNLWLELRPLNFWQFVIHNAQEKESLGEEKGLETKGCQGQGGREGWAGGEKGFHQR